MTSLPAVRHVALKPCRGEENPALHFHYEEPLEEHHRGTILVALGTFVLQGKGAAFEPIFGEDQVLFRPTRAGKSHRLDHGPYVDLSRHLGHEPPNGEIQFLSEEECPLAETAPEPIRHVGRERSMVH